MGFWFTGHVVYGGCVLIANFLILHKFHIHDGFNIVPIVMMIIAYFLFLWMMSVSGKFATLTHIFENMFSENLTWLTLLFVTAQVSVFELAYRAINEVYHQTIQRPASKLAQYEDHDFPVNRDSIELG